MRFTLQMLAALLVGLAAEGVGWYYMYQSIPVPLSYLDIQHRAEFEKVINILLPTTRAVLERDGDVAQPIAFGIELTDQLDFLNAEGRSTLDSLQLILHDFKAGAHNGSYKCIGIAYDTRRRDPGREPFDAIEFRFEHIDGEALRGWVEYRKIAPHKYWFGLTHYQRASLDVFSHHNLEWGDG